jgi:hypothetical protein
MQKVEGLAPHEPLMFTREGGYAKAISLPFNILLNISVTLAIDVRDLSRSIFNTYKAHQKLRHFTQRKVASLSAISSETYKEINK